MVGGSDLELPVLIRIGNLLKQRDIRSLRYPAKIGKPDSLSASTVDVKKDRVYGTFKAADLWMDGTEHLKVKCGIDKDLIRLPCQLSVLSIDREAQLLGGVSQQGVVVENMRYQMTMGKKSSQSIGIGVGREKPHDRVVAIVAMQFENQL